MTLLMLLCYVMLLLTDGPSLKQIPIEGVYTAEDKAVSHNLLKMWTDFAKTGNPTPDTNQWTKFVYSFVLFSFSTAK